MRMMYGRPDVFSSARTCSMHLRECLTAAHEARLGIRVYWGLKPASLRLPDLGVPAGLGVKIYWGTYCLS